MRLLTCSSCCHGLWLLGFKAVKVPRVRCALPKTLSACRRECLLAEQSASY